MQKPELKRTEAELVEKLKKLPLYAPELAPIEFINDNYIDKIKNYIDTSYGYLNPDNENDMQKYNKLMEKFLIARINGYKIKKEDLYMIKLPNIPILSHLANPVKDNYLGVDYNGLWFAKEEKPTEEYEYEFKMLFSLDEIWELQKSENAKGLNLNELKIKAPILKKQDNIED